jgi:hypothetical protein
LNLSYAKTKLYWTSVAGTHDAWDAKTSNGAGNPSYTFFLPQLLTLFNGSATVSGTLFSWPLASPKAAAASPDKKGKDKEKKETNADQKRLEESLGAPRSPWYSTEGAAADAEKDKASSGSADAASSADTSDKDFDPNEFRLTDVPYSGVDVSKTSSSPFTFSLSYSLTPLATYERTFYTAGATTPTDFNWETLYDKSTYQVTGGLTAATGVLGGVLSSTQALAYTNTYQSHLNLNSDTSKLSASTLSSLTLADNQACNEKITATSSITLNPLKEVALFSGTNLNYSLGATLKEHVYDAAITTGDPYADTYFTWDKNMVTSHKLTFTFAATPFNWAQSLSLSASLPPLDQNYAAALALRLGALSLSASGSYYYSDTSSEWLFGSLSSGAVLTFNSWANLTDSFVYSLEENRPDSNALSLKLGAFSAVFSSSWRYPYVYSGAWTTTGDEAFLPKSLAFNYSQSGDTFYFWRNRITIKPVISSKASVLFDKYSNSNLTFNLGLTVSVKDFLDFTLTTTSYNNHIYRYLIGLPGFDGLTVGTKTQTWINPLYDLYQSFDFFNLSGAAGEPTARESSNFKLSAINLTASHHMEDWDLSLTYKGLFELNSSSTAYNFNNYITFTLAWTDIPEIKTKVVGEPNDDGGEDFTIE